MNPTLISRQPLENGLTLELWDCSRLVAGDRWQLVLEARIKIPINAVTLPPDLKSQAAEIKAALGQEIIYGQREERNFISFEEMTGVLKDMEERLATLASTYLGHPQFASRFIRKKYLEFQERRRWQLS